MRVRILSRGILAAAAVTMLTAGAIRAQGPAGPPRPGPEHRKLDYFAGRWTYEMEMKAGPLGPAGKARGTDHCEWFDGGFHMLCRGEGKGSMGELKGLGILSYDAEEGAYTYYGIDNTGTAELSKGSLAGDTWTYAGEFKVSGKVLKSRYSVRMLPPDEYTSRWEVSTDGGPWITVMEGKDVRLK